MTSLVRPRKLLAAVAVLFWGFTGSPISQVGEHAGALLERGSAARGEELFIGRVPFRNGGPPCASCHSVAGLPFPGGGSLGPDLTKVSAKLGPLGVDPALHTLYFPAMTPIYDSHRLTSEERGDLKAFFQQAGSRESSGAGTQVILLLALGGLVVFLVLTGFFGRGRLRGVRRRLLERAAGPGGMHR